MHYGLLNKKGLLLVQLEVLLHLDSPRNGRADGRQNMWQQVGGATAVYVVNGDALGHGGGQWSRPSSCCSLHLFRRNETRGRIQSPVPWWRGALQSGMERANEAQQDALSSLAYLRGSLDNLTGLSCDWLELNLVSVRKLQVLLF